MTAHPYIPNSTQRLREEMLTSIGAASVDDLLRVIPDRLRAAPLEGIPAPLRSEQELRSHMEALLDKNRSSSDLLSFLGGDCYRHYVPAVCDEINSRNEFVTAYSGRTYEDHGRYQALWEYTSLMGELLEMDVVSLPTYDGYQAAATSLRMAGRLTGRRTALVARSTSVEKRSKFSDYCRPALDLLEIGWGPSGTLHLDALEGQMTDDVAAVYLDQPNGLGVIETGLGDIADLAHSAGALLVVGVDPSLLGVIASPALSGADLLCGDIQSLGIHPQFGGGHAGFIASADEPRLVREYPIRLYSVAPTTEPGEYGFGEVDSERTSFVAREHGKEWLGTTANLWAITAGAYLASMGPSGMAELGEHLLGRAGYLADSLSSIPGVKAPAFSAPHGKEIAIDFSDTGVSVNDLNSALLSRGILGGHHLGGFGIGETALYCTTEVHSRQDIDRLTDAISEVVNP